MRVSKKVKPGTIVVKTKNGWLVPFDLNGRGHLRPDGIWNGRVVQTNGWYPPRRKGTSEFSVAFNNRTPRKT